jgi:hypothetical protein
MKKAAPSPCAPAPGAAEDSSTLKRLSKRTSWGGLDVLSEVQEAAYDILSPQL